MLVRPAEFTLARPPPFTVVAIAVPPTRLPIGVPDSNSVPPLFTVALLVLPARETTSKPPLLTVVAIAVAPSDTTSKPPLRVVLVVVMK